MPKESPYIVIKESSVIGKGRDGTEYKLETLQWRGWLTLKLTSSTVEHPPRDGSLEDIPPLLTERLTALSTSIGATKSMTGEPMSRLSTGTPTTSTSWLTLPTATLDTAQNKIDSLVEISQYI